MRHWVTVTVASAARTVGPCGQALKSSRHSGGWSRRQAGGRARAAGGRVGAADQLEPRREQFVIQVERGDEQPLLSLRRVGERGVQAFIGRVKPDQAGRQVGALGASVALEREVLYAASASITGSTVAGRMYVETAANRAAKAVSAAASMTVIAVEVRWNESQCEFVSSRECRPGQQTTVNS